LGGRGVGENSFKNTLHDPPSGNDAPLSGSLLAPPLNVDDKFAEAATIIIAKGKLERNKS